MFNKKLEKEVRELRERVIDLETNEIRKDIKSLLMKYEDKYDVELVIREYHGFLEVYLNGGLIGLKSIGFCSPFADKKTRKQKLEESYNFLKENIDELVFGIIARHNEIERRKENNKKAGRPKKGSK